MMNSFYIGKTALMTTEKQIDITGQNIANVNTPGYSRQVMIQSATDPVSKSNGIYGTGVEIASLNRARNQYLDAQYRQNNSQLGYYQKSSEKLSQLEGELKAMSLTGLSENLNQFWDGWESVADNPTSMVERQSLIETTKTLTNSFYEFSQTLKKKKDEINLEIENMGKRINEISSSLANLNTKIQQADVKGTPANDLLDKFDLLIDELSTYGNVNVVVDENYQRTIYFGTDEIVKSDKYKEVVVDQQTIDGENKNFLVWDNFSELSGLTSGELKGLLDLRDITLDDYESEINTLADTVVEEVNLLHKEGYSIGNPPSKGNLFFDPTTAGAEGMKISEAIINDPSLISASLEKEEGDNRVALQIAQLRHEKVLENQSIGDYFSSILNKIGSTTASANNYANIYDQTSLQIDAYRESVKGVNINEETANLLRYQQAYQAAAKIISAADEMMSLVINLIN